MGTSHLKTAVITALEATPVVRPSAGIGGASRVVINEGYVTAVASDGAASTYSLVRIKSTDVVKLVYFDSEAQGAGKVQVGLRYATDGSSASAVAGTTPAQISATADKIFSDDIDCASAVNRKDISPGAGSAGGAATMDQRNQPAWKMAGLTTDPGGNLDVVAIVHTTAVTTGTGKLGVQVLTASGG